MKLNDFRLLVNDFLASFHFWHEIVGLSTIFRDEYNTYAELDGVECASVSLLAE